MKKILLVLIICKLTIAKGLSSEFLKSSEDVSAWVTALLLYPTVLLTDYSANTPGDLEMDKGWLIAEMQMEATELLALGATELNAASAQLTSAVNKRRELFPDASIETILAELAFDKI